MARSVVWILLAALALVACDDAPGTPSAVPPGQEFTIAPGEQVLVGGLRVSFERVVEDSRCPADAFCVQAGEVVVEVAAGRRTRSAQRLRPGEALAFGDVRLRLVRVAPYPRSDAPIEPASYRATFVVESA